MARRTSCSSGSRSCSSMPKNRGKLLRLQVGDPVHPHLGPLRRTQVGVDEAERVGLLGCQVRVHDGRQLAQRLHDGLAARRVGARPPGCGCVGERGQPAVDPGVVGLHGGQHGRGVRRCALGQLRPDKQVLAVMVDVQDPGDEVDVFGDDLDMPAVPRPHTLNVFGKLRQLPTEHGVYGVHVPAVGRCTVGGRRSVRRRSGYGFSHGCSPGVGTVPSAAGLTVRRGDGVGGAYPQSIMVCASGRLPTPGRSTRPGPPPSTTAQAVTELHPRDAAACHQCGADQLVAATGPHGAAGVGHPALALGRSAAPQT